MSLTRQERKQQKLSANQAKQEHLKWQNAQKLKYLKTQKQQLEEQYEAFKTANTPIERERLGDKFHSNLTSYMNNLRLQEPLASRSELLEEFEQKLQERAEQKRAEQERAEQELRTLPERVAALEASEQSPATPERLAEFAGLLERLEAAAQRATDTEQRVTAVLKRIDDRLAAYKQAAAQQKAERSARHAALAARRRKLATLLYDTPGAERERLAAAEGKTLGELSGELDTLEKLLDTAAELDTLEKQLDAGA